MDAYSGGTQETEVDIVAHPTAKKLLSTCRKFFSEIDNLFVLSSPHRISPDILSTPGKGLEAKLNSEYSPGNSYYEDRATTLGKASPMDGLPISK